LRAKIARLVIVGFRGRSIEPGDDITKALEAGVGGVILFDRDQTTGGLRNIESPRQLGRLTQQLREAASVPLIIAVDQEGGQVARLGPAHGFPATRSQREIGATGNPDEARMAGQAMGRTMAEAGITLDLAPVVDLDVNPDNPAIGRLGRSFSADPSVVAAMAAAEISGLRSEGIQTVAKHFPGLGSAGANTDFDRVDVTETWRSAELDPYRSLFEQGMPDAVMVAHIVDRNRDADHPASLSKAFVTDLLRGDLGWQGPVVTDDLGAVAIASTYSRSQAIQLALDAGDDLLLFANQGDYVSDLATEVIDTIERLVIAGDISEARIDASVARVAELAPQD
jgi:beta-N-acetylhexosaminidase